MRGLLFTALLFFSIPNAHAASAAQGAGNNTCGKFAEDYRKAPEQIEKSYFTWAQGFVTGLNTSVVGELKKPGRDVVGIPLADQMAFVRTYCNEHPLAYYWQAALELYRLFPYLK